MIVPIVEGHGEVESVPILLRDRLLPALGIYNLPVLSSAIRQPRGTMLAENGCRAMLQVAAYTDRATCVLVLFDSDDICARDCVPSIKTWAAEEIKHLPTAVVMARREYEAWFLGSLESLRGVRGIRHDAVYPDDPEAKRDAKGQLEKRMLNGGPYLSRIHQPALTAKFDLAQAYRRCSSFRKLVTELCRVLEAARHSPVVPTDWLS